MKDHPRKYPTIVDRISILGKRLRYFYWDIFGHNWVHAPWFPWPKWWRNKRREKDCKHLEVGYWCDGKGGNTYKLCEYCSKKLARYEFNEEVERYV